MEQEKLQDPEGANNKYILGGALLLAAVLVATFTLKDDSYLSEEEAAREAQVLPYESAEGRVLPIHAIGPSGFPKATFGVGCFWSGEQEFQSIKGIIASSVGYIGGDGKTTPTYEHVKANTQHYTEVVTLEYDPEVTSYEELLLAFWEMHDPTPTKYSDTQYRSAVFFHSPEQREMALRAKQELADSGLYGDFEIVTDVDPGSIFYFAEEEHQDYYKKYDQKAFIGSH